MLGLVKRVRIKGVGVWGDGHGGGGGDSGGGGGGGDDDDNNDDDADNDDAHDAAAYLMNFFEMSLGHAIPAFFRGMLAE